MSAQYRARLCAAEPHTGHGQHSEIPRRILLFIWGLGGLASEIISRRSVSFSTITYRFGLNAPPSGSLESLVMRLSSRLDLHIDILAGDIFK